MWEPFTERARHAVVRAQEVAQMFASSFIGTEHMAFALAEEDDDVGRILTTAIDRDASGAKRSIELAFENARRLNHNFIDTAHLALGLFDAGDDLPLKPEADLRAVRAELGQAATADSAAGSEWKLASGPAEPHAAATAMLAVLRYYADLRPDGTRVSITIERPGADALSWTFANG
jgi:ATP-dependent Clp protease ATP-binding subunit ClpC